MQLIIGVCLLFFSFLMDCKIMAPLTVGGAQHSVKYGGSLVSVLPLQRGRKVCESLRDQRPRTCIIEEKGSAGAWRDGMEPYSITEPASTGPSPAGRPLDLSHWPSASGGGPNSSHPPFPGRSPVPANAAYSPWLWGQSGHSADCACDHLKSPVFVPRGESWDAPGDLSSSAAPELCSQLLWKARTGGVTQTSPVLVLWLPP